MIINHLHKKQLSNILNYNNKVPTNSYFILRNHQNIDHKINKEMLNDSKNIRIDIPNFMDTKDIPADNKVLILLKYFLFPKIMIHF